MKSKIRAELEKNRITCRGNHFTIGGRKRLRELKIYSVSHYLDVLETIEERIKMVEKDFKKMAEKSKKAKILMAIPRIEPFSALLIIAEIGDINRFPNPEKLCFYAGLVPTVSTVRKYDQEWKNQKE